MYSFTRALVKIASASKKGEKLIWLTHLLRLRILFRSAVAVLALALSSATLSRGSGGTANPWVGSWDWTDTASDGSTFNGTMMISQAAVNGSFAWTWIGTGYSGTGTSTASTLTLNGAQPQTGLTARWVGVLDPTGRRIDGTWTQSDGQVGTSKAITLIPVSSSPLSITTTLLPDGVLTDSYGPATLTAAGGVPPYTWAASGLPAGLTITTDSSGNGQISGIFTHDAEDTSSFDRIKRQFTSLAATVTDGSGQTAPSQPLTISFTCGGDGTADALVTQYLGFRNGLGVRANGATMQFVPRCMDITRTAGSDTYDFPTLNKSNLSDVSVALLSTSLLDGVNAMPLVGKNFGGLDGWVSDYGLSTPTLTSGFRPPKDQQRVYDNMNAANAAAAMQAGKPIPPLVIPPPGGRHMFGDAVDLLNSPQTKANFDALTNAAIDAGADMTEKNMGAKYSCSWQKMKCVHADWRFATTAYAP